MRHMLFAAAMILPFAGPAAACINDSELPSHEREFESIYGTTQPAPESTPSNSYTTPVAVVSGLLLAGAAVVTVRKVKA